MRVILNFENGEKEIHEVLSKDTINLKTYPQACDVSFIDIDGKKHHCILNGSKNFVESITIEE